MAQANSNHRMILLIMLKSILQNRNFKHDKCIQALNYSELYRSRKSYTWGRWKMIANSNVHMGNADLNTFLLAMIVWLKKIK